MSPSRPKHVVSLTPS